VSTSPPPGGTVDLGPNAIVFDPSMSASTIQSRLNQVFSQQETNQFGTNRYALLFKPGTYNVDVNVGFYTQVLGLGLHPDNVTINGGVHVEADWFQGNATQNFWRGAENLSVTPPSGTVAQTPIVREKPFLYIDGSGNYQVFVPALRSNSSGTTWAGGAATGQSLPISQFYIVKPGATAGAINTALGQGKDLLFTPGVYHLNDTIRVTRANTVVLGLGLATLIPDNGITALTVADVDGAKIAGLLIDAGPTNSPVLMQVGPAGSTADHSANPSSISDVFFRIGGAGPGKATTSLLVNSNNVIIDHIWAWRGDHGAGIGWTVNTADTGLIVNGNNVTATGLFVEHYQKYNVIWNGQGGKTIFFQNELPYDPPNQAAFMNGTTQGWAAYKVGNNVTTHEAWGLGSYCYFNVNPSIVLAHSFEVPVAAGVRFHSMVTVSLGGTGTISHVINNTGGPSNSSTNVANLVNFP
jgi:hypothetical protein